MPLSAQHQHQFQHNLNFINSFYSPNTPFYDWVITVHFYVVVHLVEAFLARYNFHSANHSQRIAEIRRKLSIISKNYLHLYLASRRTRYEVWMPSETEMQVLISNHFEPLKNYLLSMV